MKTKSMQRIQTCNILIFSKNQILLFNPRIFIEQVHFLDHVS